jgi:hypothetical protein
VAATLGVSRATVYRVLAEQNDGADDLSAPVRIEDTPAKYVYSSLPDPVSRHLVD